ncbi:MAG TPA: hypothetical protein VGS28_01000 [Candidatus Saccharimonadales bacterium]|nr:hypothetical protein [Candidatus Saccharimonadales bacterium]
MHRNRSVFYFILAQLCFYIGLAICIAVRPRSLAANSGISYFGIYASTFAPYAVALLGSSVLSLIAVSQRSVCAPKILRATFIIFLLLTLGIIATPYTFSSLFDWAHTILGSILFSLQLVLIAWLTLRQLRTPQAFGLLLFVFASGVAAAIYVRPAHGFLIQSQILFQIGFGLFMIYSLRSLKPVKS